MNKRQVIILWVIAIALGAAVAAVKIGRKQSATSATKRSAGETLFESFPASDIARIDIKGATGSAEIARKNGKWVVPQRDDYPANATAANDLVRTLAELKVTQGMEAGPSFAPRFGMDESAAKPDDRGLTLTFTDAAGKEAAKVSLGKNVTPGASDSPMGGGAVGRFIRNHADESGFYAINEMFSSLSAEPARWLSQDFIGIEKIKTISLTKAGSEELIWKLGRTGEDAEFTLDAATPAEVLDTAVTGPLKSLFSYAAFEDVVPTAKVGERLMPETKRSAVIETFEGFTYTLTLASAKPGSAPSAPESATPTPPATDNFLLTVNVAAELPKERKKEEGEKPEDAKTKDEAFTARLKILTEKIEKEKAFAGRTFEVAKSTVEALVKERAELVTKAEPQAATPAGPVQNLPGGIIATTPPVQATTPPVEVPPMESAPGETEGHEGHNH